MQILSPEAAEGHTSTRTVLEAVPFSDVREASSLKFTRFLKFSSLFASDIGPTSFTELAIAHSLAISLKGGI